MTEKQKEMLARVEDIAWGTTDVGLTVVEAWGAVSKTDGRPVVLHRVTDTRRAVAMAKLLIDLGIEVDIDSFDREFTGSAAIMEGLRLILVTQARLWKDELAPLDKRVSRHPLGTSNDNAVPEVAPEAPKEATCQQSPFVRIALDIGNLTAEKNAAYGDSFSKCGDFLRILYPNGVPPEKYADMLCQVRIFDKLMRIATDKSAMGESPYRDIAGYGILGAAKDADGVKSGAEKIAE